MQTVCRAAAQGAAGAELHVPAVGDLRVHRLQLVLEAVIPQLCD